MSDELEVEKFLRRFEARAPAPLPERPHRRRSSWVGFAALLAVASVALLGGRAPRRRSVRVRPVTAIAAESTPTIAVLGAAITSRNETALLDWLDARLLPDPRREGSALSLLGDVDRDRGRGGPR